MSPFDVTKALYYPILHESPCGNSCSSKYVTRVSLKQFEEAANILYNKPAAWTVWLGEMTAQDVRQQMVQTLSNHFMLLKVPSQTNIDVFEDSL